MKKYIIYYSINKNEEIFFLVLLALIAFTSLEQSDPDGLDIIL